MWRDLSQVYPLHGVKCNQCGMVRFPIDRVCARCKARDDNTELALAKRGKVFSFIHDNLYASPEPPTTLRGEWLVGDNQCRPARQGGV